MDAKEQIAKFRYNWDRFNKLMAEYETVHEWSIKARNQLRNDQASGITQDKWSSFIADKDAQAEKLLADATVAFSELKEVFTATPKKATVKQKPKRKKA